MEGRQGKGSQTLNLRGEEDDVVVRPLAQAEESQRLALWRLIADLEAST